MQIQFLGATQTVTGSKYLLFAHDKKILVDCGLFQGLKELRLRNWAEFPVAPSSIDLVILTHAHIDHSGYVPLLVKNGFKGKIIATSATCDFCKILLPDSGYLQEEQANHANKYGYSKHKPALPLYTKVDAENSLAHFSPQPFDQDIKLFDGLTVKFYRAGHIFGAAAVVIKVDGVAILFSGDVGRLHDPCICPPAIIAEADYFILESTYGDRLHENIDPKIQLGAIINRTVSRGGTVIIPAFAVGRTQSILYYIYQLKREQLIADIPVFLDSPMATSATQIMLQHLDEYHLSEVECKAISSVARYVTSAEESKIIDTYKYPKIIISANGMATGGRVLHHLKFFAGDFRNTILFTGYQALGTRGATLLQGIRQVKLLGQVIDVNAEVIELSNVSAHSDYQEILTWLKSMPISPRKVFVTHGEIHAAESMKEKIIQQLGWKAEIPQYLQVTELTK